MDLGGGESFGGRTGFYLLVVGAILLAVLVAGVMTIRSTAAELRLADLKAQFVGTVSHELRTPLMSIRYLSELLQRGRVDDEPKRRKYYDTLTQESLRLSRLIENILDSSKIEAGMKEYRFETAKLDELVREAVDEFRTHISTTELDLERSIDGEVPECALDREAVVGAVINLLDNAVKFSEGRPKIRVRVWASEGSMGIEIRDCGIGIPEKDRGRVFQRFFRSDEASSRGIKGSGIGLTLVQHMAKAHGGSVSLDSVPGQGTTVSVHMPIASPET